MNPADVDYIIVHCSATRPDQDIGFTEINHWHQQNGWCSPSGISCGYHYIIRRDGTLERGRAEFERGAHAKGYNHNSISVCLVGGVDKNLQPQANYTLEQWDRLREVLEDLLQVFPGAKLKGHRDLPRVKKACPCFDVVAWYEEGKYPSTYVAASAYEDEHCEVQDVLPPVLPDWMRGE